jgi:hypothetical protein
VCPGNSDSGATEFWCGDGTVCDTTQTVDVSFFGISNYKFQAATILGVTANPTIQTAIVTTTASATTVPTTTSNPTPANNTPTLQDGNCPAKHDVAIGAGVGVPLGLLAIVALAWAIWERRRRSRAGATAATVNGSGKPVSGLVSFRSKENARNDRTDDLHRAYTFQSRRWKAEASKQLSSRDDDMSICIWYYLETQL